MIGGGTVTSGTFSAIDWANDKYFLQVELDPAGGTSYSNMGTTQLISVPYAKHAETAMRAINDSIYDGDSSQTNELQTLSISNDTIFLSNGGFAVIPDSSLLGVPKGGSGAGAGGTADLKDFSSNFRAVYKIGEDFDISDMKVDAQKNTYLLGYFFGKCFVGGNAITTNNTGYDLLIAKYDSNGVFLWEKHTAVGDMGQYESYGSRLSINGTDAYLHFYRKNSSSFKPLVFGGSTISGTDSSQCHILKLNSAGALQWETGFHCGYTYTSNGLSFRCYITDIAISPAGEVYYVGQATGRYVFGNQTINLNGNTNIDYSVFGKVSSNGATHTVLDTAKNGSGLGVAFMPSGNPVVFSCFNQGVNSVNIGNTNYTPNTTGYLIEYTPTGSVIRVSNEIDYRLNYGGVAKIQIVPISTGVYVTGLLSFGRIGNLYQSSNFGNYAFVLKTNSSLQVTEINDLKHTGGYHVNMAIGKGGDVLWGATGSNSYVLNDKIKYFLGATSGKVATLSSNLKAKKVDELTSLESAVGFFIDYKGGTTFLVGKSKGNFYNKGTKYTPGVYLFKE